MTTLSEQDMELAKKHAVHLPYVTDDLVTVLAYTEESLAALLAKRDAETSRRIAELEKDAARYRWLRNKANYAKKSDPMVCLHPLDNQILIDGSELDEAIDQAIASMSDKENE